MKIIYQIADENGYSQQWVNNIKSSIEQKKLRSEKMEEDKKYVSFKYINRQTNKVAQIFKNKYKLKIAFRTNNNLKLHIGQQKTNSTDKFSNSGVYKITCQDTNCDKFYVGQSGRTFNIRYKEHRQGIKYGRPSAFSLHAFDEDHPFQDIEDMLDILKVQDKGQDLDTFEAMEIYINKDNPSCLNLQEPYGFNPMFKVLD